MTTPWNTCTRSLLPSTTRTCTFNVSPGAKAGTSSRTLAASTRSVGFMARQLRDSPQGNQQDTRSPTPAPRASAPRPARPPRRGDEVGATLDRPGQRLRAPPARDPGVVAAIAAPRARTSPRYSAGRVYCGYSRRPSANDSSSAERGVAHDARHQPADRLEHHHRGHLPAGEHEVADRDLAVDEVFTHALVDPFVPTAQQREAVQCRELAAPRSGRTDGRQVRAGTAAGAARPRRPPRTTARASAPSPLPRRTAGRRPNGADRMPPTADPARARR